ncbi:MAG: hypothetical protein IK150_02460 [Lachnospiraceae bacterium]|nr:hypothetical protein [Lachnospiraceae bacterium]
MEKEISKEKLYQRIQESELYTKRFGTFAKSDYEVLMFTIYLDSLEGTARDYDISIDLGITESKVRNLRIRSQLLYPKKLDWKEELEKSMEHGVYDASSKQITIMFEDPSVQNLMKNEIEKAFSNVGRTFNPKQLVLPIESFLILAAQAEEDKQIVLEKLNNKVREVTKSVEDIEKKPLGTRFLQSVPNIVSFITNCISLYSAGKPIIDRLLGIINT